MCNALPSVRIAGFLFWVAALPQHTIRDSELLKTTEDYGRRDLGCG